jgi:hypothetical protein
LRIYLWLARHCGCLFGFISSFAGFLWLYRHYYAIHRINEYIKILGYFAEGESELVSRNFLWLYYEVLRMFLWLYRQCCECFFGFLGSVADPDPHQSQMSDPDPF